MQGGGKGRSGRAAGLLALLLAVVLPLARATPSEAGEPVSTWTTSTVRFEPAGGAALQVDGVGEFRGAIELRTGAGGVTVVNEVGFEDYVAGIQEVPASWPAAALQAQAIAARTFALRTMLAPPLPTAKAAGAHICATESCQVYRGLAAERRPGAGSWVQAVRSTAGRVLLHRGSPILAKYSSSNGGRSESGGAPYLPAVEDPDDLAVSPWARWRSVIPLDQVARALPGPGQLVELERSGDVVVARRQQADGTLLDQGYDGATVRAAVNATASTPPGLPVPLLSRRFVARTEGGQVVFDGGGYGHLLGMSQYGALGKARRGLGADDILAAYYGGLRSTAVPAERMPATIRVVVATAQPVATVASTGRFRVTAADGGSIAHLTGGSWSARPAAGGLTVSSASPGAAPPQVTATPVGSTGVRVGLSVPSLVVLRDASGASSSPGLLDVGEHELALPAPLPAGATTELVVEADAGGGRVARVPLVIGTPAPAVAVGAAAAAGAPAALSLPAPLPVPGTASVAGTARAGSAAPPRDRGPAAATAVVALLAAAAGTAGSHRARRHDLRRGSRPLAVEQ